MGATIESDVFVTSDITYHDSQDLSTIGESELDLSALLQLWPAWLVVITSLAIVFSIVGNFWVLVMGISTPAIRNSSFHLLLMNHSLANLGLSTMSYPYMVHRMRTMTVEGSDGQTIGCRYWAVTVLWFVIVALLSNAVIATNRAMACYPQYRLSSFIRSKKITIFAIVFMWLFDLFVFLLLAFIDEYGWNKVFICMSLKELLTAMMDPELSEKGEGMRTVVNTIFAVIVLGALFVCLTSYSIIIRHLCTRPAAIMSTTAARRRKDRKRALAVISLVFTVFIICWIPTVIGLAYDSTIVSKIPILTALPIFESFFTPLVYMLTMPIFRPKILCFKGRRGDSEIMNDTRTGTAVSVVKSAAMSSHSERTSNQLKTEGLLKSTQLTQVLRADAIAARCVNKRAAWPIPGRGSDKNDQVKTIGKASKLEDLAVKAGTSTEKDN